MRFMIIVKSCKAFEEATHFAPDPDVMAAMEAYHKELAQAGVLLDGMGLHPSRQGWRIAYGPEGKHITDGPFTEAKDLVAGFTLIEVRSREEALEWSRRFPNPVSEGMEAQVEVRQVIAPDDVTAAMAHHH